MNLLSFLDADKAIKNLRADAPSHRLLLACGHTYEVYEPFLRGYAAQRGLALDVEGLPFGTLAQAIRGDRDLGNAVFVVYPWDLASVLDWYTGLPNQTVGADQIYSEAKEVLDALRSHSDKPVLYIPAPIPPATGSIKSDAVVGATLARLVAENGGQVLDGVDFSLESYITRGIAAPAAGISLIAQTAISLRYGVVDNPKKVLVTDLDNTLWSGIVGEDGADNLISEPNGPGHKFHLYQSFLHGLKCRGTLIAAASRNSLADAEAGLAAQSAINTDDFVDVMANYGTKSSMLLSLAQKLNLGIDAFVFVDDNAIEIEEVSTALPDVTCLHFPKRTDDFPDFLDTLGRLFDKSQITEEDVLRTQNYKRQLKSVAPADLSSDRLRTFLRDQDMRLTVFDRSKCDQTRAIQLINKTNQFNMNGRRWSDEEINNTLENGGKLISARLEDRNGTYGEIIALLMDARRHTLAYVMSCRVFQRRVEYAFLSSLNALDILPKSFGYEATERNEPFKLFMDELGVVETEQNCQPLSLSVIANVCHRETELFDVVLP